MIYILKIKCVEGIYLQAPFERTIEIQSKTKLDDLHDYIQKLTGFDNDHCYDFFIGKNPRDSRNCLIGEDEFMSDAKKPMIALEQIFPMPKGQKLYYWFDFGDDWKFEIALKGSKEKTPKVKYPIIVAEIGEKPEQYPELDDEGEYEE